MAKVRTAESTNFTVGPNRSVNIREYLDKQLEYNSKSPIIQECRDSTSPELIDITPTVMHYEYKNNEEVNINISNLTTNAITISPKEIIGEVQLVTVDESVFDRIENDTSKKIFVRPFKLFFLLLLINCFLYLPLFVGVLCWSLFWYALLYVLSSFAFILTNKRELVTLFLLSFECLVNLNIL